MGKFICLLALLAIAGAAVVPEITTVVKWVSSPYGLAGASVFGLALVLFVLFRP